MQFIDDDIDQLFRRASEDYPLNTNSADWNKVARALNGEKPSKQNKFGKFISWLLPLTFFWLINTYVGHVENRDLTTQNSSDISKTNTQSGTTSILKEKSLDRNNTSETLTTVQNQPLNRNAGILSNGRKYSQIKTIHEIIDPFPNNNTANNNQSINLATPFSVQRLPVLSLEQRQYPLPSLTASNARNKNQFNFTNATKAGVNNGPKSYLYMGLIGGVDVSMVKFQDVSKIGYTAGALIGFAFNNRWSVESGAYYDQKSYYSDGKYFDPKLYPNLVINSVDGTCHMIELPLSVRYNFKKKENTWFASAGLSTYLMKKEDYHFDYSYPPGTSNYYYYKEFKNSTNNWFSILHLSVGYSKKLGAIGDLRIEPYIKAPLKGLGVGKLPISSTGINVGLTHKIF